MPVPNAATLESEVGYEYDYTITYSYGIEEESTDDGGGGSDGGGGTRLVTSAGVLSTSLGVIESQ